jgi:hypothetical protein
MKNDHQNMDVRPERALFCNFLMFCLRVNFSPFIRHSAVSYRANGYITKHNKMIPQIDSSYTNQL